MHDSSVYVDVFFRLSARCFEFAKTTQSVTTIKVKQQYGFVAIMIKSSTVKKPFRLRMSDVLAYI